MVYILSFVYGPASMQLELPQVFDMEASRWQMKGRYDPWYIGWANCDDEAGKILRDYYRRPDFLPDDSESGRRDWIFMGTPGFGAPYHLDNVKYPSWQAQVRRRRVSKNFVEF